MSKRSRSDILTGGTGDVNPDLFVTYISPGILSNSTDQVAASMESRVPLPVQRLDNKGKSMVMELLRVRYDPDWTFQGDQQYNTCFYISTATQVGTAANLIRIDTPGILALQRTTKAQSTAVGFETNQGPIEQDLTDGAGHGLLVATDNIYFGALAYQVSNGIVGFQLTFRWKNIGVKEYVGIVQSQQRAR